AERSRRLTGEPTLRLHPRRWPIAFRAVLCRSSTRPRPPWWQAWLALALWLWRALGLSVEQRRPLLLLRLRRSPSPAQPRVRQRRRLHQALIPRDPHGPGQPALIPRGEGGSVSR